MYSFLRFLASPLKWYYNWKLVNYKKIDGGVVYAFNHCDGSDGLMAIIAIPRKLHFLAKAEMFENPLAGWFLRTVVQQVPIERMRGKSAPAVAEMIEYCSKGEAIGIFPEGMTYQAPALREFHRGVARVALAGDWPIIPCAIIGSFGMMPHDSGPYGTHVPLQMNPPRRKKVQIIFGEPMRFPQYKGKNNDMKITKIVANKVKEEIRNLLIENNAPLEYL
ncbi:MAG: lysophospholipid acyltransferase family protein [Candidatus Woesearchaeota archaeon]